MIDLDHLTKVWGKDITEAPDHETLTAIARAAKAHKEAGKLSDKAYDVICGWGAERRKELNDDTTLPDQ
jgi:hypothetical protein